MSFRVQGLAAEQFEHFIGLSDDDLEAKGARRYVVDAKPGFPDRIGLRDLEIGETAILLNFEHQPEGTFYRASHAIFIGEKDTKKADLVDELPEVIKCRPISLRAFDDNGDMVDADLADGGELKPLIDRFFANPDVEYLHAHYAKRGCYAARIVRDR